MTTSTYKIPFNRPTLVGSELEYVTQAIQMGAWSGDGSFTRKCNAYLEQALGVPYVLLTPSCTHALEMAALLLNLGPEDEVILPSFTFTSTANAFLLRGARLVFTDIRFDTLNLNEMQLEQLISPRTKAIVVMHYAGIGCEMETILAIAQRHGLAVVEDNAQGLFGRYKGQALGTFGSLAAQSFHDTKNFTCGEGGALLINDVQYAERAEIIREKGTDRSRFLRGQVDKYTWVDYGSSYLLADLLAAFLYGQLEVHARIQTDRRRMWEYYYQHLQTWADEQDIRLPYVPPECEPSYHLFYMLLPSSEKRQALISHLKTHGIQTAFHYLPLHSSQMGQSVNGQPQMNCPVSERVSECLLRLPLFMSLSEVEQQFVVETICQIDLR